MTDKLYVTCWFLLICLSEAAEHHLESEIAIQMNASERILSRKKRYLVFPEGSSLQLVYCLTIPSIGMGSIFTIGWTAALAWELPHDPSDFLRKKTNSLQRVDKTGTSTSGDWTMKQSPMSSDKLKKTYYDPFSLKYPPALYTTMKEYLSKPSSSSIQYKLSPEKMSSDYSKAFKAKYANNGASYSTLYRPTFKSNNVHRDAVSSYVHPIYNEVHRRTRRDLFGKIEKFFEAQRKDGKACLLKAICEVSQDKDTEIGTFMEEIIKTIFRVKKHQDMHYKDEYDHAANEQHNCTEKYLTCKSSVWFMF